MKNFHLGNQIVDPLKLTKEDFNPYWIAESLSSINRYCGNGCFKLSVATHSVILSKTVPTELAMAALTHDVPEVFTGDVNGMVLDKLAPKLVEFQNDILRNLASILGITYANYLAIIPWDKRIVNDERKALFPECEVPKQVCLGVDILNLSQSESRNAWIERFSECAALQQRKATNGSGSDVA